MYPYFNLLDDFIYTRKRNKRILPQQGFKKPRCKTCCHLGISGYCPIIKGYQKHKSESCKHYFAK